MFGIYSRLFPNDPLNFKRSGILGSFGRAASRLRRTAGLLTPQSEPNRQTAAGAPTGASSRREKERYLTRQGFILTDLICAALPPKERFTILDGGALQVAADLRWRGYNQQRLRVYGFEIDGAECRRLNQLAAGSETESRFFPVGLWSGKGQRTFYVTEGAGGSSLFPVNSALIDRWKMQDPKIIQLPRELMRVKQTFEVPVDSLDRIAKENRFEPIDFMKLNIQGAELETLHGATAVLSRVLGMQVEVSFVESYVDRPFFSDVDPFIRKHGFAFLDLIGLHYLGRQRSPVTVRHLPGTADLYGQLFEAHGLYFRDPIDIEKKGGDLGWANAVTLLKLVSLAEVFHQIEFAIEVLDWSIGFLGRRGDKQGANEAARIYKIGVDKYLRYMKP